MMYFTFSVKHASKLSISLFPIWGLGAEKKNMADVSTIYSQLKNGGSKKYKRDCFVPKQPETKPSAASLCCNETVQSSKQSTVIKYERVRLAGL